MLSRLGLGLASAAIAAGLAIWSWSDFADAGSDAETRVLNTARTISELARLSLAEIDEVIESEIERIAEKGFDQLTSASEVAQLKRLTEHLPATAELFVANRAGDVLAAEPIALSAPLNISDSEWFRTLRDKAAGIYIGRARQARPLHERFFPVAGPIRGPDGSFAGAVEVQVGMAFLAGLFYGLDFGSDMTAGLYRTADGAVVSRFPVTEALLDESIATSPYFSELAKSSAQSWTGKIMGGGASYLVSARRLSNWPLLVSVSLPKDAIYAGAWRRLLWHSALAAIVLAALAGLGVLTHRQARREAMLMGEAEHRVKNVLNVVRAVINRAGEETQSTPELLSSLRGRIQSIADTQTLLSRSRWKGVSLADLIDTELRPYATETNTNIVGPVVHLVPNASHAVAMVIHELTTNAAKYGSLSRPGGHVSVQWTLTDRGNPAPTLKIEWTETGGPAIAAPLRRGYGSGVISELLTYELGGRVDLVYATQGLRCTIELPANAETVV